jgi:hypothetical protein
MTVILVTEWCVYCPGLVNDVDDLASHLAWNRSLLVWMVLQDGQGSPASSEVADGYISGYIDAAHGIRIGDGEADIAGGFDDMWSFVPNGFVLERSTMQVVGHQETTSPQRLDYVQVAEDIYLANRE